MLSNYLTHAWVPSFEGLGSNAGESHKAEDIGRAGLVASQHPMLDVIR